MRRWTKHHRSTICAPWQMVAPHACGHRVWGVWRVEHFTLFSAMLRLAGGRSAFEFVRRPPRPLSSPAPRVPETHTPLPLPLPHNLSKTQGIYLGAPPVRSSRPYVRTLYSHSHLLLQPRLNSRPTRLSTKGSSGGMASACERHLRPRAAAIWSALRRSSRGGARRLVVCWLQSL